MRICIFIAAIDKKGGGPSRSVPILAKGLSRIGIDVDLMTMASDDMNVHAVDGEKVNLVIIPNNISEQDLEKKILMGHYDLIHEQGIWLGVYHKVSRIARKHGIPYIMTPRGALEPWCYKEKKDIVNRLKKKLAMKLYQYNDIQRAACILATADMEANNLRDLGFSNPIAVVPNGIEIDDYPCRPDTAISDCKKQIIFLSRVVKKKGVDLLIDAWIKVHRAFPDWSVIIVGNGEADYISELKMQIDHNGLADCIQILPPAFGKEKYKLYVESQLFVLPTHSENFGMVIAEALACGVPVITTKGTPWQMLEEQKVGWWIELTQKNLEDTLIKALSLPEKVLFDMGRRGAQLVRENFYYVEVAKKLTKAYDWIVKGGGRPTYVV